MGVSSGRQDAEALIANARKAFWVMVAVLALIWVIQIVNWAVQYHLTFAVGIRARQFGSLPDILTAPFVHFNWSHIEGNSGPLFIFGFLAAYRGIRKFVYVTVLVVLTSGLGTWFTAQPSSVSAGASGVVFGYFGYIIVRGAFDRHRIDIVIGLVMALCFAYQFAVLLPTEGVDWQGHAFGFAGGVLGGWLFRQRRPGQGAKPDAKQGAKPDAGPAATLGLTTPLPVDDT